jgi:archaemetzincin
LRQIITIVLVLLFSCKNKSTTTLKKKSSIQLTVLNNFSKEDCAYLQTAIANYFNTSCRIVDAIRLPLTITNTEKGLRYSADSILQYLLRLKNDSTITTVGLTDVDIFTTLRDDKGNIQLPIEKYKVWGIFGLGYMPRKACVISCKRLFTNDRKKYQHRIRTVVLHEIGHNMGLPHCPTINCIMSDANEKISTVDKSSSVMCKDCKIKINLD